MLAAYGIDFVTGAYALFDLALTQERRYIIDVPVEYRVRFDTGVLHVRTEEGFKFDGRSGPKCIDWFAPNLGSINERVAWHMHDSLAYYQSLDFAQTNYALKFVLRDIAGYSSFKAELVRIAVSLSKDWFGYPKPGEEWYCNAGKVSTRFYEIQEA